MHDRSVGHEIEMSLECGKSNTSSEMYWHNQLQL